MCKLKKLVGLGLFVSSMFFAGCDNPLSSVDSITLTNVTPAYLEISMSSTGTVTVDVDASEDVSAASNFSISVVNGEGAAETRLSCNMSYVTSDKGTMTITVDAQTGCPKDTFNVTVTGTVGTSTSSQTFKVYVLDGTVVSTASVLTHSSVKIMVAAASGNNANNCASVDGSTFTYTAATASAALQASCDFVYYYITEATLSAPSAVNANINSGYSSWTTKNATKFVAATSAAWDATTATNDDAIVSAVASATANQATGLAIGDVYGFITAGGKKGLFKVTALAAGYESNKYITIDIKVQE